MNSKERERVLVIGCDPALQRVFECLEECERYQFQFAPFSGPTALLAHPRPAAILLIVSDNGLRREQALSWLRALKQKAPVVVLSLAADMEVFVASMTCGAFDYVTGFTPTEEILRTLENAVNSADLVAA